MSDAIETGMLERDPEDVACDLDTASGRQAIAGNYETATLLIEAATHIRHLYEQIADFGDCS